MAKTNRRTGKFPLGYLGDGATPELFTESRRPTQNDSRGFYIGAIWIDDKNDEIYMLLDLKDGNGNWALLYPNSGTGIVTMDTDSGTANAVGNQIDIFGQDPIATSASGNAITVELTNGGDGQLLIGGGSGPAWGTLTSPSGTIDITEGANSLAIDVISGNAVDTVQTDSGSATPTGNTINDIGDSNVIRTSGSGDTVLTELLNGSNGQLLIGGGSEPRWANLTSTGGTISITEGANSINLEGAEAGLDFQSDSGTAQSSGGAITNAGGTNVSTSASGSTLTIDASGTGGGIDNIQTDSGSASPSAAGILNALGDGNVIETAGTGNTVSTQLVNGSNGQLLIGGGSDPTWANLTSSDGSITITEGANSIDLQDATGELQFDTDSGSANPSGGAITIAGGTNVDTIASGSVVTINASGGGGGSSDATCFSAYKVGNTSVNASRVTLGENEVLKEKFDTDNTFYPGDGSGNSAQFTAPVDGIYDFSWMYDITQSPTSTGSLCIDPSSGSTPKTCVRLDANVNKDDNGVLKATYRLSSGDTVQFYIESTVNNITLIGGGPSTPTAGSTITGYIFGYLIKAL